MREQRDQCVRGQRQPPTIPAPPPSELLDTLPDAGSRFAPPSSLPTLTSGMVVGGQFRVDRLLGVGAVGQVYLAHDDVLDRDVALKVLGASAGKDEAWRASLMVEARTMARVRYENVVALYAAGVHGGCSYLVMEYVQGVDLHEWLLDRGPLSFAEAHGVVAQVSRGLQAIHDGGAVHRDIKPGNVLVGVGMRVALTDFGPARLIDGSHVSGEHGVVGTPAYVAPEMILGQHPTPAMLTRVDIYSLGVLAFELMTGRLPFEAPTPARVILDHVATPPPPLALYRADLPSSVGEAIAAAMDKDPQARPASAAEFLAWLERDIGARPISRSAP